MSDNEDKTGLTSSQEAVAEYKTVLKNVLDMRPSGMRRNLAQRLGRNPSFISPTERAQFMAAYETAHPNRVHLVRSGGEARTVTFRVPDLGSDEKNRDFDRAISEFIKRITGLIS